MLPRDMAKFGYLFLHNGQWEEPADRLGGMGCRRHAGTSPSRGHGYGYQWWIYPEHGYYAAQGLAGQTIFVVPDRAMVVVFTANLFGEGADWPHVLLKNSSCLPPSPTSRCRPTGWRRGAGGTDRSDRGLADPLPGAARHGRQKIVSGSRRRSRAHRLDVGVGLRVFVA